MTAAQLGNSIENSNDLGTREFFSPKNGSRLKKSLCMALVMLVLVGFFISVVVYFLAIKPYLAVSKDKLIIIAAEPVAIVPTVVETNKTTNFTITNSHYAKGSTQPIIPDDGILRLYSMRFCPFSHRVHLILNAKKIPYHVIYINLSEKPKWYTKVNPNGKVPALELINEPYSPVLVGSLILCEYLDEKYPDVHLFPKNPLEKAQTKVWFERFSEIGDLFHHLAYDKSTKDVNGELLNRFCAGLKSFEEELAKRNTKYFGGQTVNILDYAIWPWFERLGILSSILGEKFQFDHSNFPSLVKWISIMKDDEAVVKHYLPTHTHTMFSHGIREKNPNYNILVDEQENRSR